MNPARQVIVPDEDGDGVMRRRLCQSLMMQKLFFQTLKMLRLLFRIEIDAMMRTYVPEYDDPKFAVGDNDENFHISESLY
ncbi:unnamed protein product [Cuscuta campestris]|uniref:Uncharacterized protein n=1 Tax=Cuscuta campestris TaxID=132261 RepID=A0A484MXE1_9ASTE|nr:unnamed protein product [Cuscuta campestris]